MNEQIKLPVRENFTHDGWPHGWMDADGKQITAHDMAAALNEADALRAEVEGLREIISDALELGVFGLQDRSSISAPEDTYIRQLGEQIGFGALMDSASRMWRLVAIEKGLDGSEFTTGPCRSVRENWIAKALAAIKPNAAAGEEKQNAN